MITSLILSVFMSVTYLLFQALPTASSLPSGIDDALTTVGGWLVSADAIFPVGVLLSLLSIVLLVETSIWIFKISVRLFTMVRG